MKYGDAAWRINRQTGERCMAGVNPVWQNILAVALVIAWTGVLMVLFIRAREKQRAYLRRFPPPGGVPAAIQLSRRGPAGLARAARLGVRPPHAASGPGPPAPDAPRP